MILFDTAVLHGPGYAKRIYEESGGDPSEMLKKRRERYKERVKKDSSQMKYFNGWNNRVNKLENMLKEAKKQGEKADD